MPPLPPVARWMLAAAALLLLGALSPWGDVAGLPAVHGTHAEGWFTVAAAVLSALLTVLATRHGWRSRLPAALHAGLAALALAVIVIDLTHLDSFAGPQEFAAVVEPGWGIYLALLGALGLLLGSLVAAVLPPRPAPRRETRREPERSAG